MADAHIAHAHSGSTRFYWKIAAFLAVITIIEVIVSLDGVLVSHASPNFTMELVLLFVLLILSVIKGACVVMFFMHLRGDPAVFKFLFIVPFVMATSMLAVFLLLFSGHVGIAG